MGDWTRERGHGQLPIGSENGRSEIHTKLFDGNRADEEDSHESQRVTRVEEPGRGILNIKMQSNQTNWDFSGRKELASLCQP